MTQPQIPFSQELLRKGIHLISFSIPVIYIFISKETALFILIPLALIAIIIDVLSKRDNHVRKYLYMFFGKLLRPHEQRKDVLNGATWVLISAVLTVFIFPKIIAVTSFAILIVSDICSAIFGRKYGRHQLFDKSWEGTTAFMVSAFIVVLAFGTALVAPRTYFYSGFLAAIIGAFAEAASNKIKMDDNFAVPLSVGFTMWAFGLIAVHLNYPFLNLL